MSPLPAGSILNLSIGGARGRPDDWKGVKNVGFIFLINLLFIERYIYVCLLIFVSFLLFTPPLAWFLLLAETVGSRCCREIAVPLIPSSSHHMPLETEAP